MFKSGVFKGLALIGTSLFFGGASFFTLTGFNSMLGGTVQIAPQAYGEAKARAHAKRKTWLTQEFGTKNLFSGKALDKQMKKPSDIDGAALSNLFNSLQKSGTTTDIDSPPLTINFPQVNPNPKSIQRSQLVEKFNKISNFENFGDVDPDISFIERWLTLPDSRGSIDLINAFYVKKDIFISNLLKNLELKIGETTILVNSKDVKSEDFDSIILTPQDKIELSIEADSQGPQEKELDVKFNIGHNHERKGIILYNEGTMDYIYSQLFNPDDQRRPTEKEQRLGWHEGLMAEAREFLKATKFNGEDIVMAGGINWKVIAMILDKSKKGEELTKLERIINDVAVFYMGGPPPQIDLLGKPIIPPISQRIISQNYQGNAKHSQQFMQQIWKRQSLGDNYIFGMIYKWTNKITGKSYVGRTQRVKGTHYYRPYSSMSIRFQEEIEKALISDPKEMAGWKNQFYYDMRMIFDNPGVGQTSMDAIRNSMELEIIEIQLLGENFDKDTRIIKELENYWINGFRNQGETLYNVAGGGAGTTASYTTTGYGKRDVHSKIKFLLSNGFKGHEIGDYLGLKAQMLADAIRAATGMNARQARLYYTGERMFELMDDGIFDLDELATHFRGLDANGVFLTLASEHFPMGNEYLKGWLTVKYLREFDFDKNLVPQKFEEYLDKLGISVATRGVYHDLRTRESLYEHWQRKDFIPLLRFYASMVIKDYDTIYGFIHHLGLFREGMSAWERESIVFDLLRYNFDTAKDIYKDHYFGRLQIIVNV